VQYYLIDKTVEIRRLTVEQILGRPLTPAERLRAPAILYCSGSMKIPVSAPKIAVVGTREPADIQRAIEVAETVVDVSGVVVSGLARGVDTIAHWTAIKKGGKTIAVLGTPLGRFYPRENMELQKLLMKEHLVVSQFPPGTRTMREHFLIRNRTIALLSDLAIIVEAEERSGTIAVGWECIRLKRPLLIHESMKGLPWVKQMLSYGLLVRLFNSATDIMEAVDSLGITT
jgi:DNA processing protein